MPLWCMPLSCHQPSNVNISIGFCCHYLEALTLQGLCCDLGSSVSESWIECVEFLAVVSECVLNGCDTTCDALQLRGHEFGIGRDSLLM